MIVEMLYLIGLGKGWWDKKKCIWMLEGIKKGSYKGIDCVDGWNTL
jgi:hypothetical protein